MDKKHLLKVVKSLSLKDRQELLKKLHQKESPTQMSILHAVDNDIQEYPVSFSQERMWLLNQEEDQGLGYIVASKISISGPLDINNFYTAFQNTINNHRIFHSSFYLGSEGVIQKINAPPSLLRSIISLEGHSQTKKRLRQIEHQIQSAPFDLNAPPLFRHQLVKISQHHYYLFLAFHHIIVDGWSMKLIVQDLMSRYQGVMTTPAKLEYKDFSTFERVNYKNNDEANQYWTTLLSQDYNALQLPHDVYLSKNKPSGCRVVTKKIGSSLSKKIQNFSKAQDASTHMTFLAVISLCLSYWANQEKMVIGSVDSDRNSEDLKSLVGCFINFLPIVLNCPRGLLNSQYLSHVKRRLIDAKKFQLPFQKIVALQPEKNKSSDGMYNVGFLYQNFPMDAQFNLSSEITCKSESLAALSPLLDLRFILEEYGSDQQLKCEYDASIFKHSTIQTLLNSVYSMLDKFTSHADIQISEFSLNKNTPVKSPSYSKIPLIILSTFTSTLVEPALTFWASKLKLPIVCKVNFYKQLFQELTNANSLTLQGQGINLILLRVEDYIEGAQDKNDSEKNSLIKQFFHEFYRALISATSMTNSPFFIYICPHSPEHSNEVISGIKKEINKFNNHISPLKGVYLMTPNETLQNLRPAEIFNPQGNQIAHIPYSIEFFITLSKHIAQSIYQYISPPYKVIIVDCDYTLWDGTCGENQPIKLSYGIIEFQKFLKTQKKSGKILCLCSKNNLEDITSAFKNNSHMPLALDDFTVVKANWNPKSQNILEIARELHLSLDSMVFMDDSPIECAEIRSEIPEVLTIQIPGDSKTLLRMTHHFLLFSSLKITSEDEKRSELYKQNFEREKLKIKGLSFEEFIKKLNLKITITPSKAEEIERIAQLFERTTQFNSSYDGIHLKDIREGHQDYQLWSVSAEDKFGNYGLIGVMIWQLNETQFTVKSILLSCRALGKGIEYEMMRVLGREALKNGHESVDLQFKKTPRNIPFMSFIQQIPIEKKAAQHSSLIFKSKTLTQVKFKPSKDHKTSKDTPALSSKKKRLLDNRRMESYMEDNTAMTAHLQHIYDEGLLISRQQGPFHFNKAQCFKIWSAFSSREMTQANEHFFSQGGNSLNAALLIEKFNTLFNLNLCIADLLKYPDFNQFFNHINALRGLSKQNKSLIKIKDGTASPPLILFPTLIQENLPYHQLSNLPIDNAIYLIRPDKSIMKGAQNLEEILKHFHQIISYSFSPNQVIAAGWSFGGNMAKAYHNLYPSKGCILWDTWHDSTFTQAMTKNDLLKIFLVELLSKTGSAKTDQVSNAYQKNLRLIYELFDTQEPYFSFELKVNDLLKDSLELIRLFTRFSPKKEQLPTLLFLAKELIILPKNINSLPQQLRPAEAKQVLTVPGNHFSIMYKENHSHFVEPLKKYLLSL